MSTKSCGQSYKKYLVVGGMLAFLCIGFQPSSAWALSEASVNYYLSRLSSVLVGRPLNAAERASIKANPDAAVGTILSGWLKSNGFVEASRMMVDEKLTTSGNKDGIDFNLPGNLAAYVVRNNLPYSTLITADYCVNGAGNKINCDTGAPYTAGVLTTKAFLSRYQGRFNLGRAGTFLREFACREYPMEETLQPRLAKTELIEMFQEDTPKTEGPAEFGNGFACYTCHSQFGAHAQFFVKFDGVGVYKAGATGLQAEGKPPGASDDGLSTSHMLSPAKASSESSLMFGKNAANLRDAARIMTENPVFNECAVRNAIQFSFRMSKALGGQINEDLIKEISSQVTSKSADPTFYDIFLGALTHPKVIESLTRTQPAGE